MADKPGPDDILRLRQLIMGFRNTQLVYAAAKLGIADVLSRGGPLTPQELAAATKADAGALHRLLRALSSLGVFVEIEGSRFAMTPAAELLRRDMPGSLHSSAMLYGDLVFWSAYGHLSHAIETGRPAFDATHGQSFYDYLDRHPAPAALFHGAMSGFSELESAAILAAYDFSSAGTVVDVGGGQGALVAALLHAYPKLQAVIFDRSAATDSTKAQFADAGIGARAQFVEGDFFSSVPDGGDLYLLKSVIHNWEDEPATAILRKCREAMPQQARLIVAERVLPPGNAASEAKLFDINMLVTLGGRERTEAEYADLFRAAGLELTRVTPTRSHLSLVEAEWRH